MKKKILLVAGCMTLCAVAVLGVKVAEQIKTSSLLMENIEALTDVEVTEGTCMWGWREYIAGNAYVYEVFCNISKEAAEELAKSKGNWCCESCSSTWYWEKCM